MPSASQLEVDRVLRAEVTALGRPALVAEMDQLLDTIESPLLNLALSGRAARFTSLGQEEREEYLKRWAASPLPLKRRAFQVMKRLVLLYTYGRDGSPYAARSGYVRPPLPPLASPPMLRVRRPVAGETIDGDACVSGLAGRWRCRGGARRAVSGSSCWTRALRTEAEFEDVSSRRTRPLCRPRHRRDARPRDRDPRRLRSRRWDVVTWNPRCGSRRPFEEGVLRRRRLDPHYDAFAHASTSIPMRRANGRICAWSAASERSPLERDRSHERQRLRRLLPLPARLPSRREVLDAAYVSRDACSRGAEILHGTDARRIET